MVDKSELLELWTWD